MKSPLLVPCLALALGLLAGAGRAEKKSPLVAQRLPLPQELVRREESFFYGFYQGLGRHKVGWDHDVQKIESVENREMATFETFSEFRNANEGKVVTTKTREKYFFDSKPPHQLCMATYLESSNGFTKSQRLRRVEGNCYLATITESGETRHQEWKGLDYNLADYITPEVWAASEDRKVGDQITVVSIDLEKLKTYHDVYTVKKIEPTGAGGRAARRLLVDLYDTLDDYHSDYELDGKGQLLRAVVADTLEVVREPEHRAKKLDPARDLFADSLVQPDKELPDVADLSELVIELHGKNILGIAPSSTQSVEENDDGTVATIRLGRRFGHPQKADDEEVAECLKANPMLPIEDKKVRELARRAVGKAVSSEDKVRAIIKFVADYIEDDYAAEPLTLLDLIKLRRGDCSEHALLFNALCRANGIACREAGGLMYDVDSKAFGGHAWNEVVLDGHWHAVDPTWGEFNINPAHIQLSTGDSSMKDARFYNGGLKIRVLGMK